jgi:nucleoside-diphosphate-sugar epimerase
LRDQKPIVIVTGSSGLIGSAVIRALASRYALIGFDRAGPPYPPSEADCVTVDLTSEESVQNAFTRVRLEYGNRIASVVHLAAYYDFSGAPSEKYERVTVGGTRNLLRELAECDVEQLIFSSTMLVHAPCRPGEKITEDAPLRPSWPYPRSKVRTEELLHARRGKIPVLLLRIAGVYNDEGHSIPICQQIARIYERSITGHVFPGDVSHGQSFVHLDDTVRSIVQGVERRRELPAELPVLIGEPEVSSYAELQRDLGRLIHGKEWETRHVPGALAKVGAWFMSMAGGTFIKPWMIDIADQHYDLDITRARQVLGWEPLRRLRATLPLMVQALMRDPLRWYRENGLRAPRWLRRSTG